MMSAGTADYRHYQDQSRKNPGRFGPAPPSFPLNSPPTFYPSLHRPDPFVAGGNLGTQISSSSRDSRSLDFDYQLFGKLSLDDVPSPPAQRSSQLIDWSWDLPVESSKEQASWINKTSKPSIWAELETHKEQPRIIGNASAQSNDLASGSLDVSIFDEPVSKVPYWTRTSFGSYHGSDSDASSPLGDETRHWPRSPPEPFPAPVQLGKLSPHAHTFSWQGPQVASAFTATDLPRSMSAPSTGPGILAGASQESRLMSQLQGHGNHRTGQQYNFFLMHDTFTAPRPVEPRQAKDAWSGRQAAAPSPSPNNKKMELFKTEICRNWEERGKCLYGNRCQYAHGEEELRRLPRDPRWKTRPCKVFMLYGHCPYASRCCFRHDQGGVPSQPIPTMQRRVSLLQRVGLIKPCKR
ncbi:hypothetical protein PaG_02627 [Moesziomyces aphidis]|uniref:C3H1-type domain-containing protein n=1 Tax=Moesziomyces aphidis TaxID=84754 RepID=W3VMS8_MOEAP|nr:hypothetical protein PaG_02627 [Moesziomyces aphidis]